MIEINEFDMQQKVAESTKLIRNIFDNNFTKRQLDIYIEDAKLRFYGDASIRTADFTRKLDSAIKQINKKTNLDVSYQRVNKRGSRKIAVLRFTIKNKYKSKK